MNLDEDHLADFGGVIRDCTVDWILSNPSVGARELSFLKKDGMGPGARALAGFLAGPNGSTKPFPDFGPLDIRYYWCPYTPGVVDKTNDLSLVVLVRYGAFCIAFTGDLEENGWRHMLMNPDFRRDIIGTSIFISSHHGRSSGCCTELFDLFSPEIVVISDDERQYDSQDTDDWYRQRCRGAVRLDRPGERRYVVTTRNDGSMLIEAAATGQWTLFPMAVRDWSQRPAPALGLNPLPTFGDNALATALGLNPLLNPLTR
jgi:hypothetical protein